MASSNLQNKKSFKVKIKKKIGRLEKIITESIPKDLGISRTRVKNLISRGLIFSTISNRAIDLNHKLLEIIKLLVLFHCLVLNIVQQELMFITC